MLVVTQQMLFFMCFAVYRYPVMMVMMTHTVIYRSTQNTIHMYGHQTCITLSAMNQNLPIYVEEGVNKLRKALK